MILTFFTDKSQPILLFSNFLLQCGSNALRIQMKLTVLHYVHLWLVAWWVFFFFHVVDRNLKTGHTQKKMVTFSAFILLSISFSLACALSVLLSLSLSHTHTHTHTFTLILRDVRVIMQLQKMGVPAAPLPMLGVGLTHCVHLLMAWGGKPKHTHTHL